MASDQSSLDALLEFDQEAGTWWTSEIGHEPVSSPQVVIDSLWKLTKSVSKSRGTIHFIVDYFIMGKDEDDKLYEKQSPDQVTVKQLISFLRRFGPWRSKSSKKLLIEHIVDDLFPVKSNNTLQSWFWGNIRKEEAACFRNSHKGYFLVRFSTSEDSLTVVYHGKEGMRNLHIRRAPPGDEYGFVCERLDKGKTPYKSLTQLIESSEKFSTAVESPLFRKCVALQQPDSTGYESTGKPKAADEKSES